MVKCFCHIVLTFVFGFITLLPHSAAKALAIDVSFNSYPAGHGELQTDTVGFQASKLPITVSNDTTICEGGSVTLFASGGGPFTWADSANMSTLLATGPSFQISPNTTTTYGVYDATDTAYVTVNVIPNLL